jgi:hypothetical protein
VGKGVPVAAAVSAAAAGVRRARSASEATADCSLRLASGCPVDKLRRTASDWLPRLGRPDALGVPDKRLAVPAEIGGLTALGAPAVPGVLAERD